MKSFRARGLFPLALLIALIAGANPPVFAATAPTLVDFADQAAVFERDGEMFRVRRDERIAESGARLIHVGRDSVLVELPADGRSEARRVLLRRGARLVDEPRSGDADATALAVTAIEAPRVGTRDAASKGN